MSRHFIRTGHNVAVDSIWCLLVMQSSAEGGEYIAWQSAVVVKSIRSSLCGACILSHTAKLLVNILCLFTALGVANF